MAFFKKHIDGVKEFSNKSILNADAIKYGFRDLISGAFLQKKNFFKYLPLAGLIVGFLILSITFRYGCETKIAEIDNLQRELRDLKQETLTLSSELLGESKQSQVRQRLNASDSSLNMLDRPPFIIEMY